MCSLQTAHIKGTWIWWTYLKYIQVDSLITELVSTV